MPEWWTYTLADFLMFSPRTYYRMLQRHNEAVWPGQIVTVGLGLGILALLRRPTLSHGRIISTILAVLWAWVAWAFLWHRYASINWAAAYLVPAFALEALLLVWIGAVRGRLRFGVSRDAAGGLGIGLFLASLAFYPALAPVSGRAWRQAEIFGVAPDPTAVATLGLVLLAAGRPRWELLAVPVLWCVASGVTLLAMGSLEALAPALAALLAALFSSRFGGRVVR